jgi:hypothetical protein
LHFGQDPKRAMDRLPDRSPDGFERRMAQREAELAAGSDGPWGAMMEAALTQPLRPAKAPATRKRPPADTLRVDSGTRWG